MKGKIFLIIKTAILVGLTMSLLFSLDIFASLQAKLTDKLFLMKSPNKNIVIVAIDNQSLQKIGRWPWERGRHAFLLEKISKEAPAVIGLDVNFPEPYKAEDDQALAEAIRQAGNVILPVEAKFNIKNNLYIAEELLFPINIIASSSLGVGVANAFPDMDGIVRTAPIDMTDKAGNNLEHFDRLVAEEYLNSIGLGLKSLVRDQLGRLRINYTGAPGVYKTIPASRVLEGDFDKNDFTGKIVLIGATAPDLHDEYFVPTSRGVPMSGVEIHANGIDTIISKNYLVKIAKLDQILIIFLLSFLISLAFAFFKISKASLFSFFLLIIYVITTIIAFDRGIILDILYPILTILIAFVLSVVWKYLNESREKKQIKQAFSRYVSPVVIKEILEDPKKLKLGGDRKELTIMFSDIRGFTGISERLKPEELVSLLNDYLTGMTDIIMDSNGVVDKYIGDAIMAFWGAPLPEPEHAKKACEDALLMLNGLDKQRSVWQKRFGVEINIGIGINTGEVVIGNMGSDKRFDYTVMGDPVNLASRLESATKTYGVSALVSEFTQVKVKNDFVFRYLDKVAVKGKNQGVKIFQLLARRDQLSLEQKKLVKQFDEARKLYREQRFNEAVESFKQILNQYPDDNPSKLYLERCQELLKKSPGENWDGIYIMTTK